MLLHQLADPGSSMWLSALILLAHAPSLHAALLNVTFWNKLSETEFNVLWHGDPGNGPRQVFGPILQGSKSMEVSVGHSFSFAAAGILAPVSEFVIDGSLQECSITREIVETQSVILPSVFAFGWLWLERGEASLLPSTPDRYE